MTEVLLFAAAPAKVLAQYRSALTAAFPNVNVNLANDAKAAFERIRSIEILMTFGPMMNDDLMRAADKLRWIQALGAGVDGLVDLPSLRKKIIVTNIPGIHGAAVSEAALSAMLALSRRLPQVISNQRRATWERFPAALLEGKTVGVLGLGRIAEALAPKCKALGMTVHGFSSTVREVAGFDRVFPKEQIAAGAPALDFLVSLTPYSPATRHIIDADVLSSMKATAYLINLARGGVVDERALTEALDGHRIAGAALDVFSVEPLPSAHPFWFMENVLVTPHLAGFYDGYAERALSVILPNMRNYFDGKFEGMLHVVRCGE